MKGTPSDGRGSRENLRKCELLTVNSAEGTVRPPPPPVPDLITHRVWMCPYLWSPGTVELGAVGQSLGTAGLGRRFPLAEPQFPDL